MISKKKAASLCEKNYKSKELKRKKSISCDRQSSIQLMRNSDRKQIPLTGMKWKIFRGRRAAGIVILFMVSILYMHVLPPGITTESTPG